MLEAALAAGLYTCFYGNRKRVLLVGAGAAVIAAFALWQPVLAPYVPGLISLWLFLAGRLFQTKEWSELFLLSGLWLMAYSLAMLWPQTDRLQTALAAGFWLMLFLYALKREALHPLWMSALWMLWILVGFLSSVAYAQPWQQQVMTAALYLGPGSILLIQQFVCARQETLSERVTPPISAAVRQKGWREAAEREYRQMQIFEHDFRHHLDMIGMLYEAGEAEEARAYMQDLKQARLSRQGQRYGGEKELSYLLMAKKEACREAGVQLSYQIMGSPKGIAQMDMTALTLNLLDNAIRACEKATESGSIMMMLLSRGLIWQIELVNSGRYEPEAKPQKGHGIGLLSVRQIVEKYQGTYEIQQGDGQVIQKIILIGKETE